MVPEDKLSSQQREIIKNIGSNQNVAWIQGHAGSGKSVVMLYSLSDYILKNPNSNVAVVVFTHALKDLLDTGLKQIPVLKNKNIPLHTIYEMKYKVGKIRYDAIFCDEVQDLPIQFIEGLKNSCGKLIIAGDAAQSIYDKDPAFKLPTTSVGEIDKQIQPVKHLLSMIFRLPLNVLNMIRRVYDSLFSSQSFVGKENTDIRVLSTLDRSKEIEWVWSEMKMIHNIRPGEMIASIFFKKEDLISFVNKVLSLEKKPNWEQKMVEKPWGEELDLESFNAHLKSQKVPLMFVGNGHGSLQDAERENRMVMLTYHSSKGLDFDAVFLPFSDTSFSHSYNPDALALVALSRSKRDLIVTFTGIMNSIFKKFLGGTEIRKIGDSSANIII